MLGLTKKTEEPCAWHTPPSELREESHGICEECATRIDIQSTRRQVNKIPSYVGNRSAFEEYKENKYGKR